MQKVDVGLAILAAVALVATIVGFVGADRWTDEREFTYSAQSTELASQGPRAAHGAGANFNWTVPDNATSAALQVAVAFSGQAIQGGTATVAMRVQMPDGRFLDDHIASFPIPQGSTSASADFNLTASWANMPDRHTDTGSGSPQSMEWMQELRVLVVVSAPSDLPAASYSFMATVAGTVTYYTLS